MSEMFYMHQNLPNTQSSNNNNDPPDNKKVGNLEDDANKIAEEIKGHFNKDALMKFLIKSKKRII